MTNDDISIAIYKIDQCAGCRLCELACELGRDSLGTSIKILNQPIIGSPIPAIRDDCDCTHGRERCVEFCSKKIIKFVAPSEVGKYIYDSKEWAACPLLTTECEKQ
jgi:Fe-S-cluster-containing hydrogenase component 2